MKCYCITHSHSNGSYFCCFLFFQTGIIPNDSVSSHQKEQPQCQRCSQSNFQMAAINKHSTQTAGNVPAFYHAFGYNAYEYNRTNTMQNKGNFLKSRQSSGHVELLDLHVATFHVSFKLVLFCCLLFMTNVLVDVKLQYHIVRLNV